MNEEELYKIALSNVPKYSLLNEMLAIRDNRFPNEKVDYCINVNGYISLDVLNKYVRNINELEQLQNNWNELKKHLEKQIIDSKSASSQQYYFNTIYKFMQELEQGKEWKD